MTPIKRFLLAYAVTVLGFLCMDFTWLSLMSTRLYQPVLAEHLASQYDWLAVGLFYALYFVGIVAFAVRPERLEDPALRSALWGLLFGIIAYGTYDLTNQATLKGWPWMLTVTDMAWGGFETAVAAFLARSVLRKLKTR